MIACAWCLKPCGPTNKNVQLVLRSRDSVFLHSACVADAVERALVQVKRRPSDVPRSKRPLGEF